MYRINQTYPPKVKCLTITALRGPILALETCAKKNLQKAFNFHLRLLPLRSLLSNRMAHTRRSGRAVECTGLENQRG